LRRASVPITEAGSKFLAKFVTTPCSRYDHSIAIFAIRFSVDIRRARIEDAAGACAVLRQSIAELCHLDHGGDETYLAKWLSNKTVENVRRWIHQTHFFVAEEAERLVGVAAMTGAGKVTLNYVAPDARFSGVSKALMLRLEETARALGVAECRLESSQTALRFYQALGYVRSEQSYILPLTGSMAVVLSKRL
jgi:N-acetylglutamate synthase-like GNAT family acetyltransferase